MPTISESRAQVIRTAESFMGTPFRIGAAIAGAGVDCGWFLILCYRDVCPTPVEVPRFTRDWHLHTIEERYLRLIAPFTHPVERPQPGDVALFRLSRTQQHQRPWSHGAVVTGWPLVIHPHWLRGVERADATQAPLGGRPVMFLSPFSE
jgi:cell wall-associated NlpC family hydrolase